MEQNATLGYFGVLIAVFFFGTNYVPAKKYPTYDGIVFQWYMCSGVLCVGLVWGILSNNWGAYAEKGMYMFPEGLLGGFFFAIANLMIPTVVNTLGLGIGFMLWNGSNITMGYLVSRYGLFGVHPTIPTYPLVSQIGILCMIGSIVVYGLVKPKLHTDPVRKGSTPNGTAHEGSPLLESASSSEMDFGVSELKHETLSKSLLHPELPNFGPFAFPAEMSHHIAIENAQDEKKRKFIGLCLAIVLGCILGNCLTPYVLWQQKCIPSDSLNDEKSIINNIAIDCNPLNFMFSQCMGIYITSTVVFLIYSAFHRFKKRSMPRSAIRPAYVSGLLWATGLAGQLLSAGNLGFDQAYPLTSIGPAMVSMMWSALYFKEIQGRRNVIIMVIATSMVFLGTILRMVAN